MLENFTKVAVFAESMLLQMREVHNLDSMIGFVLSTVPSILDNDANPYIVAIATKMDELKLLPEDKKTVISVISDRATSSSLIKLAAEDMRQNVVSEQAKASWNKLILE